MLKNPTECERDTSSAKFTAFFRHVSPCVATRCLLIFSRYLLWMNKELLENRWGTQIDQNWSQCRGRFVRYHPVRVTSLAAKLSDNIQILLLLPLLMAKDLYESTYLLLPEMKTYYYFAGTTWMKNIGNHCYVSQKSWSIIVIMILHTGPWLHQMMLIISFLTHNNEISCVTTVRMSGDVA
jgi:hypothetical protein